MTYFHPLDLIGIKARTAENELTCDTSGNGLIHRNLKHLKRGLRGRYRMVVEFITTCMQSVPITTNVVSSNSAQTRCTRYNIMW